jgi:uncharacterized protein YbdZ (MbtH family)
MISLELLFDVVIHHDGDYEIRPTARASPDGSQLIVSQLSRDSCADLVQRLIVDRHSTRYRSATEIVRDQPDDHGSQSTWA